MSAVVSLIKPFSMFRHFPLPLNKLVRIYNTSFSLQLKDGPNKIDRLLLGGLSSLV